MQEIPFSYFDSQPAEGPGSEGVRGEGGEIHGHRWQDWHSFECRGNDFLRRMVTLLRNWSKMPRAGHGSSLLRDFVSIDSRELLYQPFRSTPPEGLGIDVIPGRIAKQHLLTQFTSARSLAWLQRKPPAPVVFLSSLLNRPSSSHTSTSRSASTLSLAMRFPR